jgi:hypothetical protein
MPVRHPDTPVTISPQLDTVPETRDLDPAVLDKYPGLKSFTTNGGSAPVVKDADALKTFASWIDSVLPAISDAISRIDTVDLKPGSLPAANGLKRKVNGTGTSVYDGGDGSTDGIKGNSITVLTKLQKGLTRLRDDITALSRDAVKAEDLSTSRAQSARQFVEDANRLVNGIGGGMPSMPTLGTTPPGNGTGKSNT